jgi:hypothetical protein
MVLESPEKDWLALSLVAGVGTQTLQKLQRPLVVSPKFGKNPLINSNNWASEKMSLSDYQKQWMFEVSRWKKG